MGKSLGGGKTTQNLQPVFTSATLRLNTSKNNAAGVDFPERFWVNIDPVNMCAFHTLVCPASSSFSFLPLSEKNKNKPEMHPLSPLGAMGASELTKVSSSVRD